MNGQSEASLQPDDEFNRALLSQVHPTEWTNPTPSRPYHLVVIGAGTAGLVAAAGAAGLGARVALIEKHLMGGDCLNFGCVPSKSLIAASRLFAAQREPPGLTPSTVTQNRVDFPRIMERMRRQRAEISPVDSAHRFRDLGVDVFFGHGRFENDDTIVVRSNQGAVCELKFKRALIATGARAAAPPIPGLDSVPYLTNETLFSQTELPHRFGIIGGGPIGCEMAQTFARFGSKVTLFELSDRVLPREDRDASTLLRHALLEDGVDLVLNIQNMRIEKRGAEIRVQGQQGAEAIEIPLDQLLVATGRSPNTEGLNLEGLYILHDHKGIQVNDYLRTTHPGVYAAGDVCSPFQFTHAADFQARLVIQNALFAWGPFGRKKSSDLIIPWATYTSPEVAHVGPAPEMLHKLNLDTWTQDLQHVDRAILQEQKGFVKIYTRKGKDTIVAATIVAEHAGDLISEVVVAMNHGIGLSGLGRSIHPYPTTADAIRKIGDQYSRTKLTPFNRRVLQFLLRRNVGK